MVLALAKSIGLPPISLDDSRQIANSHMVDAGIPDHIRTALYGHRVAVNVAGLPAALATHP
jgi:hypothetical protein